MEIALTALAQPSEGTAHAHIAPYRRTEIDTVSLPPEIFPQ